MAKNGSSPMSGMPIGVGSVAAVVQKAARGVGRFGPRRVSLVRTIQRLRLGGEQVGDAIRLLVVFAEHLVEYDRVPARKALFDGHEVLPGPAAKAKFLDEIQVRQYAALHDRLPAM